MRWVILFTILIALAAPAWAQDAASLPDGFAGGEMCGICHEDTFRDFQQNPHQRLETTKRWDWQGRSCEACHGAGAAHAESADPANIFGFKSADKDRVSRTCLNCHAGDETHSGRLFGEHGRNAVSCVDCHSIHQKAEPHLLQSESNKLCASCHTDVRAAFNRPFRHKLQEGAIDCVDCHNPHGAPPPAQMQRVFANEPGCLKCHTDKRGPFPFEHAPVKLESCSTCHEPHGSANPRMLVRHDMPQLCLECHAGSMNTLGGIPPAFHDLRSARFQNCTVCHSKVHGSFVSRDLLR